VCVRRWFSLLGFRCDGHRLIGEKK
jgi:hypothetical protein